MKKVAILMGSKSDFETVKPAIDILKHFDIAFDVRIISAHRTPDIAADFAKAAEESFGAVIAAAGKSAHLAGVIAAFTAIPVIALPIKTSLMGGLDSLLSMVQMPKGIPVATVGVDAAENAALLAAQILSQGDKDLFKKIKEYKKQMAKDIILDDKNLQENL